MAVALVSLTMAGLVYLATLEAARIKFQSVADDALNRIENRVEYSLALLRGTQAMFVAQKGDVTSAEFHDFYTSLDAPNYFPGLRGMGFLRFVETKNGGDIARELKQNYEVERLPFPITDLKWRAPVVRFAPMSKATSDALGFDMATNPERRAGIEAAMAAGGAPRATARVLLVLPNDSEVPQPGILVFSRVDQPSGEGSEPAGLLYVAFRTAELFHAALGQSPLLPVTVEVHDSSDGLDSLLFQSETPPDTSYGQNFVVTRTANVAGRKWTIKFQPSSTFVPPAPSTAPLMLGLFGLVLAGAIALVARYQQRAYVAVSKLHETTERSLLERELILQEMKHRIKNSIARVLAMARQTVARSATLDEFSSSFSARLQAMAASQDMLTRSRWQRADLRELLRIELSQVFGKELPDSMLKGPPIDLDETTTQALGLTFHELATNALKYGESGSADALQVEWHLDGYGKDRRLVLGWTERNGKKLTPPTQTGFGTRLIDVNITRELNGRIERHYGEGGLRVEIDIPYHG